MVNYLLRVQMYIKCPDDQKCQNCRFHIDRCFTVVDHWNFSKLCAMEEIISQQTPGGLAIIQTSSSSSVLSILLAHTEYN